MLGNLLMHVNKLSLRRGGAGGGVLQRERVQPAAMAELLSQSFLRGLTRSVVRAKSPPCIYRPEINSICHFQTECQDQPGAARHWKPTQTCASGHFLHPPVWLNPGEAFKLRSGPGIQTWSYRVTTGRV